MLAAAEFDVVRGGLRLAIAMQHDALHVLVYNPRGSEIVGVARVEARKGRETGEVVDGAAPRGEGPHEVLGVDGEIEQIARAAVRPEIDPGERVVVEVSPRGGGGHAADDGVRILVPESGKAAGSGEQTVAFP